MQPVGRCKSSNALSHPPKRSAGPSRSPAVLVCCGRRFGCGSAYIPRIGRRLQTPAYKRAGFASSPPHRSKTQASAIFTLIFAVLPFWPFRSLFQCSRDSQCLAAAWTKMPYVRRLEVSEQLSATTAASSQPINDDGYREFAAQRESILLALKIQRGAAPRPSKPQSESGRGSPTWSEQQCSWKRAKFENGDPSQFDIWDAANQRWVDGPKWDEGMQNHPLSPTEDVELTAVYSFNSILAPQRPDRCPTKQQNGEENPFNDGSSVGCSDEIGDARRSLREFECCRMGRRLLSR